MNSKRFIATSLKEVAAFFGTQVETVRTWISRGCPAEVGRSPDGGRYDLARMHQWCRQNVWTSRQNGTGGSGNSESDLKRRILEIELAERTLSFKQHMGQLVEKQAALAEQLRQNTWIKNRLLAIPHEASVSIPASMRTEAIQTWERLIDQILREMARGEGLNTKAGGEDE